ncbi:MAG: hypothetical protein PHG97_03570, partial [Candidatus Margulisbacteria bacterium]|nr:hypothetical protein [Candidatus Margulisiibacteriota bacterium]
YGRITVIKSDGAETFFENGELLFSSADVLAAEEIAHLSLLPHSAPKKILLIGGGLGGVLKELLKYPSAGIDYVEPDYKLIELAHGLLPADPRIKVYERDGLDFISRTKTSYDVIMINLPSPLSANLNRFFTFEFFRLCHARLAAGGLVTFHLETSESYLGRESKLLNRSINKTLAGVFKFVTVVPGNYNYYFGSDRPIDLAARQWAAKRIATKYFRTDTLRYILWPDKMNYVRRAVSFEASTPVNAQLRPISYYLGLLIWLDRFSPELKNLFKGALDWPAAYVLAAFVLFFLLLKFISWRNKEWRPALIVFLLGFCGLTEQLIIIYTYQSLHGNIYQVIGLLTALFMAGLAAGNYAIIRLNRLEPDFALKLATLALLVLLAALFPLLAIFPLPLGSFLIALPIGAVFSLAVNLQSGGKIGAGRLAGRLYGADLLGGALGALLTTIFLIPVFGLAFASGLALLTAAAAVLMAYP